jgi:FtsH-binding integral membrane protein
MSDLSSVYTSDRAAPREVSVSQLLGQVMFLVAVALGFCALGTLIGRDLSLGTARACSFAGFGMLLVSSFAGERFRVGPFAMAWLFAIALLIGLGLGPVIAYFAEVQPAALTQAFALTAADAIWLATGIVVSIVNIFLSLLNIFSSR